MDAELAQPVTNPHPPTHPHATQVVGGLGLSLTAANYRLTRPCCALHDCLSPRSGYPEPGSDGERWRERWLGGTEKTEEQREEEGGRVREREEIESSRGYRGGERENRRDEWEKRKGERSENEREVYSGGNRHSGLERTD